MANHFSRSVDIAVPADEAWALVGDPAGVGSWFGAVAECRMEDDVRIATMRSGAVLRERIVEHDDQERRYSYTVLEGIPNLTSHLATLSVAPGDGRCTVTWEQQATSSDPDYDIEARLGEVLQRALDGVRERLES